MSELGGEAARQRSYDLRKLGVRVYDWEKVIAEAERSVVAENAERYSALDDIDVEFDAADQPPVSLSRPERCYVLPDQQVVSSSALLAKEAERLELRADLDRAVAELAALRAEIVRYRARFG